MGSPLWLYYFRIWKLKNQIYCYLFAEEQKEIVQKLLNIKSIIEGNKRLVEMYTQKIQNRIDEVWGEVGTNTRVLVNQAGQVLAASRAKQEPATNQELGYAIFCTMW